MRRAPVCLLWWLPLLTAQVQQQDPFDVELQAYWKARSSGNSSVAVTHRERARRLAAAVPADSPLLAHRAQSVASLYDSGGLNAEARAMLEQALAKTPADSAARTLLLSALADNWEQDRNLLKAVVYREQAVAAVERQAAGDASGPVNRVAMAGCFWSGPSPNGTYEFQRLATLYREVGRRQDAARLIEKVRSKPQGQEIAAFLYEQDGQTDRAAAMYKSQAEEEGADPQRVVNALQSLARVQQTQQEYAEAAATLRQAAKFVASSDRPEVRSQAVWVGMNLATVLTQTGQPEAADRVYEQLVAGAEESSRNQAVTAYANYLSGTKRAAQAESLLKEELANHTNLQSWEESNLYNALANAARDLGDEASALSYQRLLDEKQRAGQAADALQVLTADDVQRAESAARAGNVQEAMQFAIQAIDKAPRAADRDQVSWRISATAEIVGLKDPAAADDLYRRLFTLLESWSSDTAQPLLGLYPNYARFLMQQQRWGEAANTIDAYQKALIAARGSSTGRLGDVLELRIEAARRANTQGAALDNARELLALEERLAGTTSEPYLRALETLAETLDTAGDFGRSLPLRRQAVATVDTLSAPADVRRGYTRINAAFALARAQQFDEAERLGSEAVAIGASQRPPQPGLFEPQLRQIREMKPADK